MSGDVLSQEEVESLLSTMETDGESEARRRKAARSRERVTPYDFRRPERVGKEQMHALQSMHEGFGRNFGAALSALLRTIIDVKVTGVDQLTYSEFVYSLENPTCFILLKASPLDGNIILDINPSILFPVIDRMLGGGTEVGPLARRPLTEIELRLVGRITKLFLEELKRAWQNVLALDPSVERVESNPQLVQIVPPNEVVVLISFELALGDNRGMMNLCIPFNSLERISGKLTANSWMTYGAREVTGETIDMIGARLDEAKAELVVTLAETTIRTEDLMGLRVGDIITTEKDIHEPLQVSVQGLSKFTARPGAHKGHKAIQVVERLSLPNAGIALDK
jgi:flagellar motor switch protein FliM